MLGVAVRDTSIDQWKEMVKGTLTDLISLVY